MAHVSRPTIHLAAKVRAALMGILAVFAGVVFAAQPAAAGEFSASQKAEIEAILKSYLLQNPEILHQAIVELEKREKTAEAEARGKILSDTSGPLYTSANQAIIGNPDGKITLIEFFDYNCGYCKKALGDLAHLMRDNPDLRVILRDFPILSEGSIEAAQVEAAVRLQLTGQKFWEFHQKLLNSHGPIGRTQALAVAKDSGVDIEKLTKDSAAPSVKEGIEESDQLGRSLALTGTPSYVIGDEVVVGAVGYDQLKAKLDNVRKCGKAVCS
jgi:protein-disulfide isomerase